MSGASTEVRFVLLTAAKNEERDIASAIASVVRQTIRPVAWFIVDDGSSDRTAAIVEEQAATHRFIHLVRATGARERSYGAQYRALMRAYERAQSIDFDFVGVQDADIAVAREDYYEQVLAGFDREPRLGITGGYIHERQQGEWRCRRSNSSDSVAGGIQMFRRACFDEIGGYSPLSFGGEDWLAAIDARRAGWLVRALPELAAYHHRPTSTADGRIRGQFRLGMRDASFGSHPVFEIVKCARRVGEAPRVAGSFIRLSGYLWWRITRRKPLLPDPKSAFLRHEQMQKLRSLPAHMSRWHGARKPR